MALALMRQKNFKLLRAEGSDEGNCKLSSGAMVTVKYVGTAFSGDYIAECVVYRFSLDEGFITDLYLKRNMVSDEYVRLVKGRSQSEIDIAHAKYKKSLREEADDTEDDYDGNDEEDENTPEFRGLVWKKDGKEISEALVDDDVTLFCEVKNIDDGSTVKFSVFEQGEKKDAPIAELEGEVLNGKVEAAWKVIYKGGDNSSTDEEIEAQGWTVPDYYFVVEYGGVESESSILLLCNSGYKRL